MARIRHGAPSSAARSAPPRAVPSTRRGRRGAAGAGPWPPRLTRSRARHRAPRPALRPGRGPPPGAPSAELDDDAVAPPRRAGHRGVLGRRIGPDEVRRERAGRRRRPRRAPRAIAPAERPGLRPAAGRPPGVVLGAQRLLEDGEPRRAVRRGRAVAGRQHVREHEPVLGQRAGLVGDDQVDRAQRLLGVQPPDEHAAPEQPVGARARG